MRAVGTKTKSRKPAALSTYGRLCVDCGTNISGKSRCKKCHLAYTKKHRVVKVRLVDKTRDQLLALPLDMQETVSKLMKGRNKAGLWEAIDIVERAIACDAPHCAGKNRAERLMEASE